MRHHHYVTIAIKERTTIPFLIVLNLALAYYIVWCQPYTTMICMYSTTRFLQANA